MQTTFRWIDLYLIISRPNKKLFLFKNYPEKVPFPSLYNNWKGGDKVYLCIRWTIKTDKWRRIFFKFLHPSLNTDEFIDIDKKNKKNLISFIRKSHYPERLFPPEQFRINEVRVYLKWINYFLNFYIRCVKSIYYWNQQN